MKIGGMYPTYLHYVVVNPFDNYTGGKDPTIGHHIGKLTINGTYLEHTLSSVSSSLKNMKKVPEHSSFSIVRSLKNVSDSSIILPTFLRSDWK